MEGRCLTPPRRGPGLALCLWQLWLNLGCLFYEPCQVHPEPEPWTWVGSGSQRLDESSPFSLQLTLGCQAS